MARVTAEGVQERLNEVIPMIQEHDKILIRGNGEPSLQERMRNIDAYIKEEKRLREERAKEEKDNRNFYFRLFVTVAFTNFVTLVGAAAVWFMKIYPLLQNIENLQKASF